LAEPKHSLDGKKRASADTGILGGQLMMQVVICKKTINAVSECFYVDKGLDQNRG